MDPPTSKTTTPSATATPKRPNPRTVLPREQYQERLEQIIQRDYFPGAPPPVVSSHDNTTTASALVVVEPPRPASHSSSSSLSQFHATTTSAEMAAWDEQQREAVEQKRRHHEQQLLLRPTTTTTTTTTIVNQQAPAAAVEHPPPPRSTELRNALFFVPPDRKSDDSSRDDTHQRTWRHASELGRMEPPAARGPTVVATATRFPSYNNNSAIEQHWEGSSDDEEDDSVATDLDAASVALSLPTEIRLGRLRKLQQQQQQPQPQNRHLNSSTAVMARQAARMVPYALPPESVRDPRALGGERQNAPTAVNLTQPKKQPPRPRPPCVRSGDSLGVALRAAYQNAATRQAKKKQRTRDGRSRSSSSSNPKNK